MPPAPFLSRAATRTEIVHPRRDEAAIKELSIGDMRAHYLRLARGRDPAHRYVWACLGERTPCRILSVRSTPAHLGLHVPNDGSRLLTHEGFGLSPSPFVHAPLPLGLFPRDALGVGTCRTQPHVLRWR